MERYNLILNNKDFKAAVSIIQKNEENRIFCCHGMEHLLDTARIAYIIVLENKLDISKDIVYAAALLHDIGRSQGSKNHNISSSRAAEKILPACGYSQTETQLICRAIENHRGHSKGVSALCDVLSAADHLSRQCYSCHAFDQCYWEKERRNMEIIY